MMKIEKIYPKISARILAARISSGMTQWELSRKVKMSRPSIANIEVGRQRIMLHDIFKFSKALKKNPKYFLQDIV